MENTSKSIVLSVRGLKKKYGKNGNVTEALRGIDLDITSGEFVAIMGPSGSGKTTLLNIVSTIDTKSEGDLVINGQDTSSLSMKDLALFRRKKLGFIFQDFALLDTLTGYENIALPLSINQIGPALIGEEVNRTAALLGVGSVLLKYPYEMSGGQKQRVAAARAIITRPALVLADEPTGALDSKASRDLLEGLSKLNQEEKATIMMVTHDAFASSYSERVLFLKDGLIEKEIRRGYQNRKEFYDNIITVVAQLGE